MGVGVGVGRCGWVGVGVGGFGWVWVGVWGRKEREREGECVGVFCESIQQM